MSGQARTTDCASSRLRLSDSTTLGRSSYSCGRVRTGIGMMAFHHTSRRNLLIPHAAHATCKCTAGLVGLQGAGPGSETTRPAPDQADQGSHSSLIQRPNSPADPPLRGS